MSVNIDPLLTIADLDAMPDDGNRYELFEGEMCVSRAPGLSHQRVLGNLHAIFRAYLEHNPIVEVMVTTGLIRDYIINEEKTAQIRDAIAAGTSQYGMQTFDQSLFYLHQSGLISLEEALRGASNPDEFRLRLSGIQNSSDQAKEEMERISNATNTGPLKQESKR